MKPRITPTGHEIRLDNNNFIVSKTDPQGRITYANRIFMSIAGYPEDKLLGVQHNIVRHPEMPRAVFRFLWDTLKSGSEFFGYVKNLSADGSHYWVFANVTPDYDTDKVVQGYYSVRRRPHDNAIKIIAPIYSEMLALEQRHGSKEGPQQALNYLHSRLQELNTSYERLVLNLQSGN